MRVCGIAAEYDPFHSGHQYHINETRRVLGSETVIVCAISGNYTQRGDLAFLEKYARAEMAVRGGADLVVELPLAAALSSAEGFARGAVDTLHALGCDSVSFGAETPDIDLFRRAADALDAIDAIGMPDSATRFSYAAWRQDALRTFDTDAAALLDLPNNTLGVEYCRAARQYGMQMLAIQRRGAAHNAHMAVDGFPSASLLRTYLCKGNVDVCRPYLPQPDPLMTALANGDAPAHLPDALFFGILRRLLYEGRICTGSADGFDQRLQRALYSAGSFAETIKRAKTRHFPAARIRRACLRLALGLAPDTTVSPRYLRVLALRDSGRSLLRNAALPLIVKPAAERYVPASLQADLALDVFADDLYALALPNEKNHAGGSRFRKTPFYLPPM